MDDYIAKPVDERVLYSKIIGFIKKHELLKPVSGNLPGQKQLERLKCTDLKYLKTRTKSDPKLMMEMISLYLQQTPGLIHEMKQSLLNNDWTALNAVVHKMIPSFLIVGIDPAFKDKAKIIMEYASMQRNAEAIPDLVFQIENVCTQACMELEEAYNIIKNSP
jgi:YesN/AraC family two-component response regulator